MITSQILSSKYLVISIFLCLYHVWLNIGSNPECAPTYITFVFFFSVSVNGAALFDEHKDFEKTWVIFV